MRLLTVSYLPVTASLTGFASNVTGAGPWVPSPTTPTDGVAHLVTIRNDAAVDHSAKTLTLTGTDADGKAMTETLAAPGASATVTSLKHFKTLTSVAVSATIGADTFDLGWAAEGVTQTFPTDRTSPAGAIVMVDISGTINYTGQETAQDVQDLSNPPAEGVTFIDMSGMTAKTADTISSTLVGTTGFRIKVNTVTNGATMKVSFSQPNRAT